MGLVLIGNVLIESKLSRYALYKKSCVNKSHTEKLCTDRLCTYQLCTDRLCTDRQSMIGNKIEQSIENKRQSSESFQTISKPVTIEHTATKVNLSFRFAGLSNTLLKPPFRELQLLWSLAHTVLERNYPWPLMPRKKLKNCQKICIFILL